MSEAFWDIQLHFIISTSLLVKSWQMFSWTNVVLFIWISTLSCYYQQLIPHRFLSDVLLHYKTQSSLTQMFLIRKIVSTLNLFMILHFFSFRPIVAIGSYSGLLKLWNYRTKSVFLLSAMQNMFNYSLFPFFFYNLSNFFGLQIALGIYYMLPHLSRCVLNMLFVLFYRESTMPLT